MGNIIAVAMAFAVAFYWGFAVGQGDSMRAKRDAMIKCGQAHYDQRTGGFIEHGQEGRSNE